jgi:hypothetical protein
MLSFFVVHLRWDDVGPEQYEELCRALPDGAQRPAGCLLRQRRRQGRAVLGTEVWIDGSQADRFLTGLPDLLGHAGMGQPQSASFAIPACFAVGYGVSPAQIRESAVAAAPVLPTPRAPQEMPVPSVLAGASPG